MDSLFYSWTPEPFEGNLTTRRAWSSAWMLRLVCLGALAFLCGPRQAQAAFLALPTVNVGQQSQPLGITINISSSGLATAPQALTQGVAGFDYSVAVGGTCAANVLYVAGQQCTVNVVFAPKYPGLRMGAVVLKDVGGNLLGSTTFSGIATGSLSVLNPGVIATVAGDGELNYRSDGVPATQAPIFLPYGVMVDPAGNMYISDTNNSRIRRVDFQSGLISTIAGNGTSGYSGDGGLATQATISQPGGLIMDGVGNIFFADSGNDIIRRIDAISGIITTIAGVPLTQGYSPVVVAATSADLSSPRGISFDSAGDLYIADTSNNVIREVNAATGTISTIAGTGFAGYNGDNLLATAGQLNTPWSVSVGADNSLLIADLSNNRVRKVSGGVLSTVVGNGIRGFEGDSGPANAAELNDPASVILDPAGNLYIADSGNNRIRKVYVNTGIIQTLTGNDSEQFAGDGGPANQASLYAPYNLFFDQGGNLFVADTLHNRIRSIPGTPVALQYAVIRVDRTSAPQIEGLENDGNGSLNLSTPVLSNAALDTATTTCSFTVAIPSSGICNLGVEFAPTVIGNDVLGSVTLNSGSGNSPAVINVSGQVLSVEPTTVILTSSLNPSIVAQSVTFTATVSSHDPSRSGPVTFLDGTTPVCSSITLSAGTAVCTTSTLTLGVHNITASYAGDDNNAASLSSVLVQTVKQQPNLVLSVSPNPAIVTQNVTLSLTASASSGIPSGTIVFYDSGTALSGAITLTATGQATYSTAQLAPGQHNLSAGYAGDSTNAAGPSNIAVEAVIRSSTVATLVSSNATVDVGTSVAFTARVFSSSGLVPTGSMLFTEEGLVCGTSTVDSNGFATLAVATFTVGTHHIVATYSGDTDNAGSSSSPLAETVQQIQTVTVLTSDTNPASAGATVHLVATVAITAGSSSNGSISGLVTFTEGATILGTAQVNPSRISTIAVSTLGIGQHNVVATFAGNTNYATSTSNTVLQSIKFTATSTILSSGAPNSLSGTPVSFTASVASSTGTPTGNVIFQDGTTNIGQVTLNSLGIAVFSTSTLAVGRHTVTAVYQGDGSYIASTSASLAESISLATTGLMIAGPAAAVDVTAAAVFTATLSGNGLAPTGALILRDGNTVVATLNATNTGIYNLSVSTLSIGTHILTAAYTGDGNNSPSVSPSITVAVQQGATTTSLTLSTTPSVLGENLTLTAAVSGTVAHSTGSFTFEDSGTIIGSATVGPNGTASLITHVLAFGAHTLIAVYSGDTNHAISSSAPITEQIVQTAIVTLASNVNPSISGAIVNLSTRVVGAGSLVPTGNVTFSDGAVILSTVMLDANGLASFQSSAVAVGSHFITVNYTGDKNYATTVSGTLIQTVESASTQITLTASSNPAVYGTPLTLTATVISNGGVATGPVSFTDGAIAIGPAILNPSGLATFTTATLALGSHSIVVNYPGDGKASASSSIPLALNVRQLTSVALTTNVNPSLTLNSVVLTATVTNGNITPVTGTVTFSEGAIQLGQTTVDTSGHATLTVSSLAAGNHMLVARYEGDNNDFSSASPLLTQTVQLRATTTSLTTAATDPTDPQQVTLIGIVRWTGPSTPTGIITFRKGTVVVGSSQVDASGATTINILIDTNSTESIVATYVGNGVYASSASSATTVTSGAATQFTLALNPPSGSLPSLQHTNITLTITSVKSFTDTLQFGCLGLPYAATCTFSSGQTRLNANGTSTIQLTIDTGNPLGSGAEAMVTKATGSSPLMCFLPGSVLAGLVLLFRRRHSLAGVLLLFCFVVFTLSVTGCANGLQTNGTPPGIYTFEVTASGQATGAIKSQLFTLTVTQ